MKHRITYRTEKESVVHKSLAAGLSALVFFIDISSVAQAQIGFPSDPTTIMAIVAILTSETNTPIEGKCLDGATATRYRNTWSSNRDRFVRENLVQQIPNIESVDIVDARLVKGITCWYIQATIKKR